MKSLFSSKIGKNRPNFSGMQVRLLSLGATVHSVIYPGEGPEEDRDVVLGFDKVDNIILPININTIIILPIITQF